jgi:RNA polymerase sigma-70 factor (ECF subfamily)
MQELKARRRTGCDPLLAMEAPRASEESMASEQPQTAANAFAEIVEAHRALLHRVAVRLSGNAEAAKDLVQETLYRAWRYFDQLREGSNAATWLITIMTNVFYDQLRHELVKRKAMPALEIYWEPVECDPTISDISDADLHSAIEELEPDLRDVVELCDLKQMKYREASELLNVASGTIGSRLTRARARLRTLITDRTRDVVKP